jgi:hypothetical protein
VLSVLLEKPLNIVNLRPKRRILSGNTHRVNLGVLGEDFQSLRMSLGHGSLKRISKMYSPVSVLIPNSNGLLFFTQRLLAERCHLLVLPTLFT